MKKKLLILLGLLIGITAFAQQRNYTSIKKAELRPYHLGLDINDQSHCSYQEWENTNVVFNRNREIMKTTISTSLNVFGIVSTDQRVVSAHPEADMVIFGNRAGGPMGGTGNDIKVCFSNDKGVTWDNILITPQTDYNFRYPSTIIYNPQGNTDPENMIAVFSGPFTDAAGWKGQYYGSIVLNELNKEVTYEINEPTVYLNHMNTDLSVTNSGKVHVFSHRLNGTSGSYTHEGWEVLNGEINNTTNIVEWELPRVLVKPETTDDNRIDADHMVYSPDGSIGYLLGTGSDTDTDYNPYGIEWPIVYKTLDHGQTWDKIEPFDFSEISVLFDYLYSTRINPDLVIPRWYNKWVGSAGNGATVDINGNLHIAGVLRGTITTNPDSLNYFYNDEPNLMFDVFMNGDGTWNAQFVDTIRTESVASTVQFTTGWDQRIAMNRTADGSKVFVTWADTDPLHCIDPFAETNLYPDLFIWGFDVLNQLYTNPVNLTSDNAEYWGDNFFMYSSDMVIEDGADYWIPVTTSFGPDEDGPMTHQYVSGVGFNEADFINVGIGNNNTQIIAGVSQNYPNPYSGSTQIDVNLTRPSTIRLEVYDLAGRLVYEIPAFFAGSGSHSLSLDASDFNPGVYIYSVTTREQISSRKMIVR